MLADIVEKAERTAGGVTTKTGSCKFCKQAAEAAGKRGNAD